MKKFYLALTVFLLTALLMSCKEDTAVQPQPTAYDNADVAKGGMMYNQFWATETGFNQNDTNLARFTAKPEFFRCKTCHAWDLLGRTGSYIGRGPTSTRPRVADLNLFQYIQGKTPEQLFNAIKTGSGATRRDVTYDLSLYHPTNNSTIGDQMPKYSQILSDAQIWDIVKFLREGVFDVTELYDGTYTGTYPTGTASYSNIGKNGNPVNGVSYFSTNCAVCHGSNGTAFLVEGLTLGDFARSKPNEVHHKVKYGQLGSIMLGKFDINLNQMKDLYKAVSDTTAYPN